MKRGLCLLLILVSLVSCASASPEKEIQFRGVEWGASLEEAKNSFFDPIRWESPENGSCFGMDYWTTGDGPIYVGDVCMSVQSEFSALGKINVAGLKASVAVLRFAKLPDGSEPKFIMGEYVFATGDSMDNYFDLMMKLMDLYGNYDDTSVKTSTDFDYYTVWKDSEGNAISLYRHGDSIVSLRYISSEIDSLLSAAELVIEQEKKSNYNGL